MSLKNIINNDDDENEEEEYLPEERDIKVGDKIYKSLRELRQNATDEELVKLYNDFDRVIIKTEKKLDIADNAFKVFVGLGIVGGVLMFAGGMFHGVIKNIISIFAPMAFLGGSILAGINFKKYIPIEADLEYYYYAYDQIDDELNERCEKTEKEVAEIEIFADIFQKEKE